MSHGKDFYGHGILLSKKCDRIIVVDVNEEVNVCDSDR
jgi:hypothetical protein